MFSYPILLSTFMSELAICFAHGSCLLKCPKENTVFWSCLNSGYAQNGMPDDACILFKEMISAGLMPNHYAIGSALRACQDGGPTRLKLGMDIHALISKSPFFLDLNKCDIYSMFDYN
ncbi:hypothetical protein HN873_036827 [Arachis hypogaea]|nr:Putative pentatricopeptide repeat-containing protein [Arachis hypogaea]